MAKKPSLEVDLGNPLAVQSKLKELDAAIRDHKTEVKATLKAHQEAIRELERYRQALAHIASPDAKSVLAKFIENAGSVAGAMVEASGTSIQAVTEAVVNQAAGEVTADDVLRHLPEDTKRETVNWALWNAAKHERIQKTGTGRYARLSHVPQQPQLEAGK